MTAFLLDTNVVVWLLIGHRDAVPAVVREALEDVDNEVWVSAASVWEIAIKRSLGKVRIEEPWRRTLTGLGFAQLPITAEHAAAVESLPWHHKDPFDRILVAQAGIERLTLVSANRLLRRYDVEVLW